MVSVSLIFFFLNPANCFPKWLTIYIYLYIYLFIYLFIYFWLHWVFVAVCRLFSSCGEQGLLFIAVHGLLTALASLVVEHRL